MSEWTVDKAPLLEAVQVLDLVPLRAGIASSMFFQIKNKGNGTIQLALASEVKGEWKIKGEGEWPFKKNFYLDRRVFIPFVVASSTIMSGAPFIFTVVGKSLRVGQGARRAVFAGQPPLRGYGFEGQDAEEKVRARLALTTKARRLIHCAVNCATPDHIVPQLNTVYVKPNGALVGIYATDRKILYQAKAKDTIKPSIPIPLPLFLVNLLEHDLLREVQWKKTHVSLVFEKGQIWQTVSQKAKTMFPAKEIDAYIERMQKAEYLFQLPVKKFVTPLLRLGEYLANVRRQDWVLELVGVAGNNEISLVSRIPQTLFRERLRLEKPLKHAFRLDWPLDKLLPVFQFLATDKGLLTVRTSHGRSYVNTTDVNLIVPGKKVE